MLGRRWVAPFFVGMSGELSCFCWGCSAVRAVTSAVQRFLTQLRVTRRHASLLRAHEPEGRAAAATARRARHVTRHELFTPQRAIYRNFMCVSAPTSSALVSLVSLVSPDSGETHYVRRLQQHLAKLQGYTGYKDTGGHTCADATHGGAGRSLPRRCSATSHHFPCLCGAVSLVSLVSLILERPPYVRRLQRHLAKCRDTRIHERPSTDASCRVGAGFNQTGGRLHCARGGRIARLGEALAPLAPRPLLSVRSLLDPCVRGCPRHHLSSRGIHGIQGRGTGRRRQMHVSATSRAHTSIVPFCRSVVSLHRASRAAPQPSRASCARTLPEKGAPFETQRAARRRLLGALALTVVGPACQPSGSASTWSMGCGTRGADVAAPQVHARFLLWGMRVRAAWAFVTRIRVGCTTAGCSAWSSARSVPMSVPLSEAALRVA